jgi:hypothetical protein
MGESPLTMYMWSPVRNSFPTVCSRYALIPFPLFRPSGPIPGYGSDYGQYFPIPPKIVNVVFNAPLPDFRPAAL